MTTKKYKEKKGDDDDKDTEDYEEDSSGDIYNDDDDDDDEEDEEDDDDDDDDEDDEDDDDVPSGGFFNKYDEENKRQQVPRGPRGQRDQGVFLILKAIPKKEKKLISKVKYDFYKKYNSDEKNYFDSLPKKDKDNVKSLEDKLIASKKVLDIPMRFKILDLDINERTKRSIIFKLECLSKMSSTSGEYHKINNWLSILNEVPFNKYYNIPVKNTDGNDKICAFLSDIRPYVH